MSLYKTLKEVDPIIYDAIQNEIDRQNGGLELIASENFVSKAVLQTAGCVMTNKYAEGYPGKRYYGGCEWVDVAENLARDRAKELFGAEYANVQPHSGTQPKGFCRKKGVDIVRLFWKDRVNWFALVLKRGAGDVRPEVSGFGCMWS